VIQSAGISGEYAIEVIHYIGGPRSRRVKRKCGWWHSVGNKWGRRNGCGDGWSSTGQWCHWWRDLMWYWWGRQWFRGSIVGHFDHNGDHHGNNNRDHYHQRDPPVVQPGWTADSCRTTPLIAETLSVRAVVDGGHW
jgi:hypothetical protein